MASVAVSTVSANVLMVGSAVIAHRRCVKLITLPFQVLRPSLLCAVVMVLASTVLVSATKLSLARLVTFVLAPRTAVASVPAWAMVSAPAMLSIRARTALN